MNKPSLDLSPLDDLHSDVVWLTVYLYAFTVTYLLFGA
jgi:hypothetical protein